MMRTKFALLPIVQLSLSTSVSVASCSCLKHSTMATLSAMAKELKNLIILLASVLIIPECSQVQVEEYGAQ